MIQRITVSAEQCSGSILTLKADQAHYLIDVLRLRSGDRFIAQDGKGTQWTATLKSIATAPPQADIVKTIEHSPTALPLRLVVAPTKGNSFDAVIRQATELGATHIYPVITERTVLKPSQNRQLRWQKIAAEACEQSERPVIPQIFETTSFAQHLTNLSIEAPLNNQPTEIRYICSARTNNPHLLAEAQSNFSSQDLPAVTLAIGPEGGWTSSEISDAIRIGYKEVSLGSAILRAVTASITALSLITAARNLLI